MKPFNAEAAQAICAMARTRYVGKRVQHWKGDYYKVLFVDVDEASGQIRISYWSVDKGWAWSRTLEDFEAYVEWPDGKTRSRFMVVP